MAMTRVLVAACAAILVASAAACGPASPRAEAPSSTPTASATLVAIATATPSPVPSPTATPDWNALPVPADEAAGTARQLAMVEAAIRDPSVSGAQLSYIGHLQQLVYSRLGDYPDWQAPALAGLPPATRDAVKGALEARKQIALIRGPTPRGLPDWKILTPKPIATLLSFYKEAEAKYGI